MDRRPDECTTQIATGHQAHVAQRIDALRRWRSRLGRQTHAGTLVASIADQAKRTQREVGGFARVWLACVEPEVAGQSHIASFRGGVATIVTRNASLRWVIDRELRSGLLARLRAESPVAITAVRVRSG